MENLNNDALFKIFTAIAQDFELVGRYLEKVDKKASRACFGGVLIGTVGYLAYRSVDQRLKRIEKAGSCYTEINSEGFKDDSEE